MEVLEKIEAHKVVLRIWMPFIFRRKGPWRDRQRELNCDKTADRVSLLFFSIENIKTFINGLVRCYLTFTLQYVTKYF